MINHQTPIQIFNFVTTTLILLVSTAIHASAAPQPPACHAPAPDSQKVLPGDHVAECTPLDLTRPYPPSSGPHYPIWANYQAYPQPVSVGYWLRK